MASRFIRFYSMRTHWAMIDPLDRVAYFAEGQRWAKRVTRYITELWEAKH